MMSSSVPRFLSSPSFVLPSTSRKLNARKNVVVRNLRRRFMLYVYLDRKKRGRKFLTTKFYCDVQKDQRAEKCGCQEFAAALHALSVSRPQEATPQIPDHHIFLRRPESSTRGKMWWSGICGGASCGRDTHRACRWCQIALR